MGTQMTIGMAARMTVRFVLARRGNRPDCLILAALFAVLLQALLPAEALAQGAAPYPSRPIRMVIPNGPGGPSDILARLIAPRFSEVWGQPVIPENRAGATGLIAAELVAKSPPDGHTMIVMTSAQLMGTLMHQKYLLGSEFGAVGLLGSTPFAIAVNASLPVRNLAELIALAKAKPGQLAYASSGPWSSPHLCMESINELAGIQMLHVPHATSAAANTALMSGQVQAYCASGPTMVPLSKQGKIRLLAVASLKPTRLIPDLPPVASTLPGYEMIGWLGLQVTRGTPPDVVNRINSELGRILRNPEVAERMSAGLGVEPQPTSPAEFAAFLQRESDRWGRFLKDRNAKPED